MNKAPYEMVSRVCEVLRYMTYATIVFMQEQPHNPLHGITLKTILEYLFQTYGWEELSRQIKIKCFEMNPSVASSLTFLRKTPWAREKVERLYINTLYREKKN